MATRGRKSAASLSVVTPLPHGRSAPPSELTAEQAEEWRAVVARMPADWFGRETHALLTQYCRHVIKARLLAQSIDEFRPEWLAEPEGLMRYDKLLQMAEREGRAMSSLATRMRITQQSHYRADKAMPKTGAAKKPWEFGT